MARRLINLICLAVTFSAVAFLLPVSIAAREFPPGTIRQVEHVPASRLRNQMQNLPPTARIRAVAWLGNIHFTDEDLPMLHVDSQGGVFYADNFLLPPVKAAAANLEPVPETALIPVGPLPPDLLFHSTPGAPNVIYLNFCGETVSGTAWNTTYSTLNAVPFSIDADYTTFNDAEQVAIKRVWQRVAEDYAPFNIDVTTARPASFTPTTAHALITRSTDANGNSNPNAGAAGMAYIGVFGIANYANYSPAWIYFDALASDESYIAEAVSHEVGHNLGLSHDGTTAGATYYGGHGDGETSWGPIMGTGYYRNVSQWSKGEYFLANNTQDDLAIINAKLPYRIDDHGNTSSSATPLTLTGGTNVLSTTPEDDPARTNSSNKGIIERSTDVDVFSLASGDGLVDLTVNPWIMPAGTRGGNVDLLVELRDANGTLLSSDNASGATAARIQTTLTLGIYYLHVRTTGVGNPASSTPSGYTSYACMGQYFITGTVVRSSIAIPPGAELQVIGIAQPGVGPKEFTVTYTDNIGVSVSSLDDADIVVTGPNSYLRAARLVSINQLTDGTPRIATYAAEPPNGIAWRATDDGVYSVLIQSNQVVDTEGAFVPPSALGSFTVAVPTVIYFADLDATPGWTLEGLWQHGTPAYNGNGPVTGFTGPKIIAYNLSGNYENNLPPTYATTPPIDCSAAVGALSLRFQRWLRLRSGDTASIQVSTNGAIWANLWSATRTITDSAWQVVDYSLPYWASASSSVQLRWGMASGSSQNDIGWNIDDVQILAQPATEATPPSALLQAANITDASAVSHPITVTYADGSGVRVSTLNPSDVIVIGPNGFANSTVFVGVDNLTDGSPRVASYSIAPPGGTWDTSDNGSYQLFLEAGEVSDIYGNYNTRTLLGAFVVALNPSPQALVVTPISLSVPEGSNSLFTIRLAAPPTADVTVTVLRVSGPSNLVVQGYPAFIFNSQNWSNPVPVIVASLPDPDQVHGIATFECRSDALVTVEVTVTEQDLTPDNMLTVTVNEPAWGTVTPPGGIYPVGAVVQVTATPSAGYIFMEWRGSYLTSNNPLTMVLNTNVTLEAVFIEAVPQAVIVTPTNLVVLEGSNATFTIRLARPPAADISVFVTALGGSNIVLQSSATKVFTSLNWSNAQQVVLSSLPDFDRVNESVLFECSAPGLPSVFIQVTEEDATPDYAFSATPNNPAWGAVNVTGGIYPAGNTIQLAAMPSNYFRFVGWTGGYTGSNNPITIVLDSDLVIEAVFAEIVTADHTVPYWWLAQHDSTSDFESTQNVLGSNGLPLWQSYIAGLDPANPGSQLRLSVELGTGATEHILRWNSVTGRVYTVLQTTDLSVEFTPLPGASQLPVHIRSFTNRNTGLLFYRLEVRKP